MILCKRIMNTEKSSSYVGGRRLKLSGGRSLNVTDDKAASWRADKFGGDLMPMPIILIGIHHWLLRRPNLSVNMPQRGSPFHGYKQMAVYTEASKTT
ncbi:hypothetical protein AKJ16_DCAP08318, partial [Drosera capensis]